jgi:amino acid transporter
VALAWWLEAPVWLGGSLAITAVAVVDELLLPLKGGWRVPVALGFVWIAIALAAVPLRAGRWVPAAGAATQVALLGFFTGTVALYAARHGVPASIVRAGVLTCALYSVPVLAILLVVPGELSSLTGFIDALASVLAVYGRWSGLVGGLAAGAFLWVLLANGLTWIMGSSRTLVAAGLDGVGPGALARISARTGTPVQATVAGGVVATATASAAFALAGNDNARYFSVVLALAISLLALGNLVVFAALPRLRRTHSRLPRAFRVPGGGLGAWTVSGLAAAWSALALLAVLWPGLGTADPDAHLPEGFAGDRAGFLLAELVPLAAVVGFAAVFAYRGRRLDTLTPGGEEGT